MKFLKWLCASVVNQFLAILIYNIILNSVLDRVIRKGYYENHSGLIILISVVLWTSFLFWADKKIESEK